MILLTELNKLADIACGKHESLAFEHKEIFEELHKKITKFTSKLELEINKDESDSELVALYSRNILEGVCTALLGRLDSYRLLIVYKSQLSDEYDISKKSNLAISWFGDMIAEKSPKEKLWSPNHKLTDFSRALLSKQYGELYWERGFSSISDEIGSSVDIEYSYWIEELLGQDEHQSFERAWTELYRFFSAFSKGIHLEFLINEEIVFDSETVLVNVTGMLKILSWLCLASHCSTGFHCPLDFAEAYQNLVDIEKGVDQWTDHIES